MSLTSIPNTYVFHETLLLSMRHITAWATLTLVVNEALQPRGFIFQRNMQRSMMRREYRPIVYSPPPEDRARGYFSEDGKLMPGKGPMTEKDARIVKFLSQQIVAFSDFRWHHKIFRTYQKIRFLGGFPDGPGFRSVLEACAKQRHGALADHVVNDMLQAPPADGVS